MGISQLLDLFGVHPVGDAVTKWDKNVSGLGLRINKSGAVWIAKFRLDGKQVMLTLGSVDIMSYEMAKEEIARAKASGSGTACFSFTLLADKYMNEYASRHKRTWKEDLRRINRYLKPAFGSLPLTGITTEKVRDLHCQLSAKTPRQADQVCALLRVMLNKAIKWKLLPRDFEMPTDGIDWHQKRDRERFITQDEMPRLLDVISKLPRFEVRAILILYILTGCRKNELVDLKWSEVDLINKVIYLSGTRNKSGEPVSKPLSDLACLLIEQLPKDQTYVFPGRYKNSRMKKISYVWMKVRADASLDDVILHDLRRTTGSWLAQSGASLHLISKVLGQTTEHVTKVYSRFEQKHIKQAMQDHTDTFRPMFDAANILPEQKKETN